MSLYYEDFPADDGAEPQLPPLLTAPGSLLRSPRVVVVDFRNWFRLMVL